jgi:hypothetical protein
MELSKHATIAGDLLSRASRCHRDARFPCCSQLVLVDALADGGLFDKNLCVLLFCWNTAIPSRGCEWEGVVNH